jgi:nitrile hydratase
VNGIHDMGGMDNMGALVREKNEPIFHADWERQIFAHTIAVLGARYCNLDELRRSTEWMPAAEYVRAAYYEIWLHAVTAILLEKKLITEADLARGRWSGVKGTLPVPPLPRDMAVYAMNNPIPASLDLDIAPRFKAGADIIARNIHPIRHTRLPRYARGKRGKIDWVHGVYLLPDTNAHGGPDRPQHVYSVRFSARELWGNDAPERDAVYLDLWDDYLEPHPA